jgi:two-component system, NarL family, response regulator DegU
LDKISTSFGEQVQEPYTLGGYMAAVRVREVPEGHTRDPASAVVIDAYPLWLEAVEAVLRGLGLITLGKATSPSEGLRLIAQHRPEIVVTDIDFGPDRIGGTPYLLDVVRIRSDMKVIVLSTHREASAVTDVINAGATAYAMKHVRPDDLASAIRQIFEHSIFFAPTSAGSPAVHHVAPGAEEQARVGAEPSRSGEPAEPGAHLTRREREILTYVSEGMANADIARRLWVSEQTVKFHLSNIYRKLNVTNRTQASRWARLGKGENERAVGT